MSVTAVEFPGLSYPVVSPRPKGGLLDGEKPQIRRKWSFSASTTDTLCSNALRYVNEISYCLKSFKPGDRQSAWLKMLLHNPEQGMVEDFRLLFDP